MTDLVTEDVHDVFDLDDASDRELLLTILGEVAEIRKEHNETVARINGLLETLMPHVEQVGPMIEALANNPMFKMLAGGGKKEKK
jgi:hypothetical protein